MRFTTRQFLRAAKRAETFCTKQPTPPPFAALPGGFPTQVTVLHDRIAAMEQAATDQEAGARSLRSLTVQRRQLRGLLHSQHLKPIHMVARAVERATPGLSIRFWMPALHSSEAILLQVARAAVQDLQPYQARFAPALGNDFIDRLTAAADAVDAATDAANVCRDQAVGATAILKSSQQELQALLKVLNAMVEGACDAPDVEQGRATLRRWKSAIRIGRTRVSVLDPQAELTQPPVVTEDPEDTGSENPTHE